MPSHLVYRVLGIKARVSYMLDTLPIEVHIQP